MKTCVSLAFVLALSLVTTAAASEHDYVDSEVRKSESFSERFRQAILPGFHQSSKSHDRANLAQHNSTAPDLDRFSSANSFEASFTDGTNRRYVGNEDSSFAADPTSPTGNVFDFRF